MVMLRFLPLLLVLTLAGCAGHKAEPFNAHVVDWAEYQFVERHWLEVRSPYYTPPYSEPGHYPMCWEASDRYIASLTLDEYRRQRNAGTLPDIVECYCNEVAAVNCLKTWINHPVWEWPTPWIEEPEYEVDIHHNLVV